MKGKGNKVREKGDYMLGSTGTGAVYLVNPSENHKIYHLPATLRLQLNTVELSSFG